MNIIPINIDIKDNWRFGLVAFLVDRVDFLKDVEQARQELKISKLLDRSKIEREQALRNEKATIKKYGHSPVNGIILYISTKYDDMALKLQNKYKKSDNFRSVIKFAVISGMVLDRDYEDEDPLIFVPNKNEGISDIPVRYPKIAILVNPETNPDKVKTKLIDLVKYYKAKNKKLGKEWLVPDTVTNIKRDRVWYWQKRNGMSYEEIRRSTENINQPATWQAARNSISRYKSHLD